MPEYVFPHCQKQEGEIEKIKGISRLYAYPCKPCFENESKIVILDSGAYGLSKAKIKMSDSYMKKLSEHYLKYYCDNTLCIAPDEFLNPIQSMQNIRKWFKKGLFGSVTAVLQASKKNEINLDDLKYQAEFYRQYTDTICFSNNNLRGMQAQNFKLNIIFDFCKKLEYKWIHVLGAGFSIRDICDWFDIGNFDSMDSIAYYTTKNKEEFGSLNAVENIKEIMKHVSKYQDNSFVK